MGARSGACVASLDDRSFDLIAFFTGRFWSRFDGESGGVSRGEASADNLLEPCAEMSNVFGFERRYL
jgi:hypothetical protein